MTRQDSIDRFKCKCCYQNITDLRVVDIHEKVEKALGHELKVNSGYRCQKHNAAIKGSPTSSHILGLADDIDCDDSRTRFLIIMALMGLGVNRIGLHKSFIHFDIDRKKDKDVVFFY
jgi:zinc D-Ala-D-Ala carboxypeptidase